MGALPEAQPRLTEGLEKMAAQYATVNTQMNTMSASTLFGEEPLISEEFRNRYSNLFRQDKNDFQHKTESGDAKTVTILRRTVDRHYKTAPITYLVKPLKECRTQTFAGLLKTTHTDGKAMKKYKISQESNIRITKPTYSEKVEGVCRPKERFMNGEHAEGVGTERNCIISVTRYRQAFPALKSNGDDGTTHRDILLCMRMKLSDLPNNVGSDDLPNTKKDGKHSDKYQIVGWNSTGSHPNSSTWRRGEKLDSRMVLMMRTKVNEDILRTENEVPRLYSPTPLWIEDGEFSMERKQSSEGVSKNAYTNGTPLSNVVTKRTLPKTIVFGGPVTVQYANLTLSLTEGVYVVKGKIPDDAKVNIANARYHVI